MTEILSKRFLSIWFMLDLFQCAFNNPRRSPPVAERVYCLSHFVVGVVIIEQLEERPHQRILIRTDEPSRAGCDRLRPFGRVAGHQHRLSETRGLLLYSPAV